MITSVVADLHCHTLASSHAYSTVTELAGEAARKQMLAVACTDHGVSMQDAPHIWHFRNLDQLPPRINGVRVLRGVEANVIGTDGSLDMEAADLEELEIVVASLHRGLMPFGSMEEMTAAWTAIAKNPLVDIIGHSGDPRFAYDYDTVIPLFGQYGKLVEINENTFAVRRQSLQNCVHIAQLCKQHGVRIVVDSDAHYHASVGKVEQCLQMLQEIDFPSKLIVNGSADAFKAYLCEKHISL